MFFVVVFVGFFVVVVVVCLFFVFGGDIWGRGEFVTIVVSVAYDLIIRLVMYTLWKWF